MPRRATAAVHKRLSARITLDRTALLAVRQRKTVCTADLSPVEDSARAADLLGADLAADHIALVRRATALFREQEAPLDPASLLDDAEDGLGPRQLGAALTGLFTGPAILTTPYLAVALGWAHLPILAVCTAVFGLTGDLMGRAFEAVEERRGDGEEVNYRVMAEEVLADLGLPVGSAVLLELSSLAECFSMGVWFFVFIGQATAQALVPAFLALQFAILLLPPRVSALVLAAGVAFMSFVMLGVLGSALSVEPYGADQAVLPASLPAGLAGTLAAFSATAICVGDHAVFHHFYNQARSPAGFRRGLLYGNAAYLLLALVLSTCLYATLGAAEEKVCTQNIGEERDGSGMGPAFHALRLVCNAIIALRTVFVGLPAFLKPCAYSAMEALSKHTGANLGTSVASEAEVYRSDPWRFALRFAIYGVVFGGAAGAAGLLGPRITELNILVSALFKACNTIVIPVGSYLVLCKPRGLPRAALGCLVAAGVVWCVFGTTAAVRDILSAP